MDFIKDVGVGKKCTQAGFGAEQNCPPAIFGARIVLRIRITKNPSAQSDKLFVFVAF